MSITKEWVIENLIHKKKEKLFESSLLTKIDSKKSERYWQCQFEIKSEKLGELRCRFGQIESKDGEKGKEQISSEDVKPKVKRSIEEQGISQMASKILDKIVKTKYTTKEMGEIGGMGETDPYQVLTPMSSNKFELGKSFKEDQKILVMPKLDGVRMLAYIFNDEVKLLSRNGKYYDKIVPYIESDVRKVLSQLPKGSVLDGEAMIQNEPFDVVTSFMRTVKDRDEVDRLYLDKFRYNVFMFFVPEMENDFKSMFTILKGIKDQNKIVFIRPKQINFSIEEIFILHDKAIKDGFEGLMLYDLENGKYEHKRSKYILKVKKFIDDEYLIVDVQNGKGKFKDIGVFTMRMDNGKTFNANPTGSEELRKSYLRNKDSLIGKMGTVRYFELTKDGVPRFPSFIAVRDYE